MDTSLLLPDGWQVCASILYTAICSIALLSELLMLHDFKIYHIFFLFYHHLGRFCIMDLSARFTILLFL